MVQVGRVPMEVAGRRRGILRRPDGFLAGIPSSTSLIQPHMIVFLVSLVADRQLNAVGHQTQHLRGQLGRMDDYTLPAVELDHFHGQGELD